MTCSITLSDNNNLSHFLHRNNVCCRFLTVNDCLDKPSHSDPAQYIREDDLEDSSIALVNPSAGIDKDYMVRSSRNMF